MQGQKDHPASQEPTRQFEAPARSPKDVFKSHVSKLPREEINPMFICGQSSVDGRFGEGLMDFIVDADLWKTLTPLVGRCDCMVEGKYHQARAFSFDTPHLHIWCESETGSRGTSWFLARKDAQIKKAPSFYSYWSARDLAQRKEVEDFFERLALASAEMFPERLGELRLISKAVEAFAQAREIAAQAAPAPARGRNKAI